MQCDNHFIALNRISIIAVIKPFQIFHQYIFDYQYAQGQSQIDPRRTDQKWQDDAVAEGRITRKMWQMIVETLKRY